MFKKRENVKEIEEGKLLSPKFDNNGLIPVVTVCSSTKDVLMLGYMNNEAYEKTTQTNNVWFFSRSRNRLWEKGESSKNYLRVKKILIDCDGDSILILANPEGPTCHTLANSCFETESNIDENYDFTLEQLQSLIMQRKEEMPENSYTTKLFAQGLNRITKKIGEEASEVIIASLAEKKKI